jgi:hypothetical protein
LYK